MINDFFWLYLDQKKFNENVNIIKLLGLFINIFLIFSIFIGLKTKLFFIYYK